MFSIGTGIFIYYGHRITIDHGVFFAPDQFNEQKYKKVQEKFNLPSWRIARGQTTNLALL